VRPASEAIAATSPRIARARESKPRGIAGLHAAARQLVPISVALFALPFTAYALHIVLSRDAFAVDFHYAFWPAAHRVVHGLTPYVEPNSPIVAGGAAFVYPAPAALLFAPFGLIGRGLGEVIFTLLNIAALIAALRLLGIRDLRVYGMTFLWAPVFSAWQTANITLLLALGVALLWRHRERPYIAGAVLALLVSVKLFLWPLGLWLLATRRYRAGCIAVAMSVVVNVVSWLILGTHELSRYSALTRALTHAEERRAYTVTAFALHHGVSRPAAYAIGLTLAAAVGIACVHAGRRGADSIALLLGVATCLLATPLVWVHYFALLIVPVAIARPRLSPLWGLPFLMWVCPPTRPLSWQLIVAMAVLAAVCAGTIRALRDGRTPGRPAPAV
jgi:hypothetical protein